MRVDVPYHSASLDSVQVDLCKALKFLKPKAPKITTYSTVSGGRLARNQDAAYWFDNCRQCVQLHGALQTMLNENIFTFVVRNLSTFPSWERKVNMLSGRWAPRELFTFVVIDK